MDELVESPSIGFAALVAKLQGTATTEGPWLVETWLMHAEMEVPWIPLVPGVGLIRAVASRDPAANDADAQAATAAYDWLGATVRPPLRRLDLDTSAVDSTRTAALVTAEAGVKELAGVRARARAQYAVAGWVVLAPPTKGILIPDVGVWVPQPNLRIGQRVRDMGEPQVRGDAGPTGRYDGEGPYSLPTPDLLVIPFEAMAHTDRHSAQAVLSASVQHLAAARASRLLPSERIRGLLAGMEALGHQGNADGLKNFLRLVGHFGLWTSAVAQGWDEARLRRALQRMTDERNIATHGADAALLDLGYPADAERQMRFAKVMGYDVGSATLLADLEVTAHLLGRVIAALYHSQTANGWDDGEFTKAQSGKR